MIQMKPSAVYSIQFFIFSNRLQLYTYFKKVYYFMHTLTNTYTNQNGAVTPIQ